MASKRKPASFRSWPQKKLKQKRCARNSQRTIVPNGRPDVRIVICCPPGAWKVKRKKCDVGLRAHLEYKKGARGKGFKRA